MTTTLQPPRAKRAVETADRTLADLIKRLGGVSPSRILLDPPPGTATERDLIRAHEKRGRLCELVEGTLVEKGMGLYEAVLTAFLIARLEPFVRKHRLGIVTTPDLMMRLFPGTVRGTDVAVLSWRQFPNRKMPRDAIPEVTPDLAVEVLSRSNTKKEMERKRREYFIAGAQLVWEIDPIKRTVKVYQKPDEALTLTEKQALDGGNVLPGFELALKDLFAPLDECGQ